MIRRPPRSTQSRSSAASDVYKRQVDRLRCRADRADRFPGRTPIATAVHSTIGCDAYQNVRLWPVDEGELGSTGDGSQLLVTSESQQLRAVVSDQKVCRVVLVHAQVDDTDPGNVAPLPLVGGDLEDTADQRQW